MNQPAHPKKQKHENRPGNSSPKVPEQKQSGQSMRREPPRPPAANVPTQAQIYDNLRRIGELEDKKKALQNEIDSRTSKLQTAMSHVAEDSLLFKMLKSLLDIKEPPAATQSSAKAKPSTAKSRKRSTKRKSSTKKTSKKSSEPKSTPKKSTKRKSSGRGKSTKKKA